jgi:hypothetical protein
VTAQSEHLHISSPIDVTVCPVIYIHHLRRHLMSELQGIAVVGHQVKKDPKPYVTYSVKGEPNPPLTAIIPNLSSVVSTSTRTWLVHRRYNDFVALHAELKSSTGKEPPGSLPPKHAWSLTRNVEDSKVGCGIIRGYMGY